MLLLRGCSYIAQDTVYTYFFSNIYHIFWFDVIFFLRENNNRIKYEKIFNIFKSMRAITKPGRACPGHISPQNETKLFFYNCVCILGPCMNIYNLGQKKKKAKAKMAKHLVFNIL